MKEFFKKKILVSGGSGFIGQNLIKKLVALGAEVTSLSRTNKDLGSASSISSIEVDLRDKLFLKEAIGSKAFDYFFNLSGYVDHSKFYSGGRSVIDAHYTGTLNLLEIAYGMKIKKFIHVGSSDEYGNSPAPQSEDLRERPISCYSVSKTGITHLIQALTKTEKFPGVVVRLFLVYGPGQNEQRFLPQIIKGCLNNKSFSTSKGEQLRDFCYIGDVINGLIKAAVMPESLGHVINIASGCPVSIKTVIENVVKLVGKGTPDFGSIPYRKGENMELYADITKASKLLGWNPEVSLNEGLQKTINWFVRENKEH